MLKAVAVWAVAPFASVTVIFNPDVVPTAVGVPVISPVAVFRVAQAGSEPAVIAYV
jgi:hypothetical protein